MSATTNTTLAVVLTGAAIATGALLSSGDASAPTDGGIIEAGPGPLIGNFYLRFPSEADFDAEVRSTPFWRWEQGLVDAGVDDAGIAHQRTVQIDAGQVILTSMGHNFDIVGTIVKPIFGTDGGTETLDGWHVNFSGILPEAWEGHIVQPENPVRGMR